MLMFLKYGELPWKPKHSSALSYDEILLLKS